MLIGRNRSLKGLVKNCVFFSLLKNKRQNLWQIETADETEVFIYNQCKPKRYLWINIKSFNMSMWSVCWHLPSGVSRFWLHPIRRKMEISFLAISMLIGRNRSLKGLVKNCVFFSLLKNKRQNLWQIETADETEVFIYNQCKPKRYLWINIKSFNMSMWSVCWHLPSGVSRFWLHPIRRKMEISFFAICMLTGRNRSQKGLVENWGFCRYWKIKGKIYGSFRRSILMRNL